MHLIIFEFQINTEPRFYEDFYIFEQLFIKFSFDFSSVLPNVSRIMNSKNTR